MGPQQAPRVPVGSHGTRTRRRRPAEGGAHSRALAALPPEKQRAIIEAEERGQIARAAPRQETQSERRTRAARRVRAALATLRRAAGELGLDLAAHLDQIAAALADAPS